MAWTAPRTWVTAELVTSAQMNTDVRDNLLDLKGDAAWTAPVLGGTWVNYGGGVAGAGYRGGGGWGELHGVIKSGTINTAAFTLPAGYRPAAIEPISCSSFTGAAWIVGYGEITTTGVVTPVVGGTAYFALTARFRLA